MASSSSLLYIIPVGLEGLLRITALVLGERMKADCGIDYTPSQVVVSSGAKHLVYLALRVLVNPGDEVILPAPFWVSYIELIKMKPGQLFQWNRSLTH